MKNAFLLRLHPVGEDRVPIARAVGHISIGWGKVGAGVLDESLDRSAFAQLVHDTYYSHEENRLRSGQTTGQLWRFIRTMRKGDLVLVPHWAELHVARVTGDPTHDPSRGAEHWAYQRTANWLTGPRGVPRDQASQELRARARTQRTCLDISDLAVDVADLL